MSIRSYLLFLAVFALLGMSASLGMTTEESSEAIVERGRYLVTISGCNDCHTPGYMQSEGDTPEELWLTGDSFGWRGPWGTTYAPNLRLSVANFEEAQWVTYAQTLRSRPPMPWFNLNKVTEDDLRAIYHYIRHLGPAGKKVPEWVPPDREPATPYASFPAPPES